MQGPQLLIVVPTKELGVQTVMLIYKLFGGSVNSGIPGEPTNMFNYSGPRGVKVRASCLPLCMPGCTSAESVKPMEARLAATQQSLMESTTGLTKSSRAVMLGRWHR